MSLLTFTGNTHTHTNILAWVMTHGNRTSELAAHLASSYTEVLYCVLSYSYTLSSAVLTAYGEKGILCIYV